MDRGRKSWNEKVRSVTLFPQQSKQGANKAVPPCNHETTVGRNSAVTIIILKSDIRTRKKRGYTGTQLAYLSISQFAHPYPIYIPTWVFGLRM